MAGKQGGWKRSLEAAIQDAMKDAREGEVVVIDMIEARKVGNPIHEYRVVLRP